MRCLLLSLAIFPTITKPMIIPTVHGRVIFGDPVIVETYNPKQEKCLATMIYGEARGEPEKGQIAVAYTAVNRALNRSVCDVVLAPMQYSVFNDNPGLKEIALNQHAEPKHKSVIEAEAWRKAVKVAQDVMRKKVPDPTKGSTHYLNPELMNTLGYEFPEWSKQYKMTITIHGHQFYKYAPPPKEKINATVST